jgi:hypothetical protein
MRREVNAQTGMLECDLLRETAAPGDAEDVELVVSEPVEQRCTRTDTSP